MKNKREESVAKFEFSDILGIVFTLGVSVIGIAYMLQVTGEVRDDMTPNSTERNATDQGMEAIAKFPAKLGMIVTIIIAALIIGLLVRHLWIKMGTGQ